GSGSGAGVAATLAAAAPSLSAVAAFGRTRVDDPTDAVARGKFCGYTHATAGSMLRAGACPRFSNSHAPKLAAPTTNALASTRPRTTPSLCGLVFMTKETTN